MWIFLGWVFLIGVADHIPQKHANPCVAVDVSAGYRNYRQTVWNKELGVYRMIPFPFRWGKEKQKFKEGYVDWCTREKFNGIWWYKDSEVK